MCSLKTRHGWPFVHWVLWQGDPSHYSYMIYTPRIHKPFRLHRHHFKNVQYYALTIWSCYANDCLKSCSDGSEPWYTQHRHIYKLKHENAKIAYALHSNWQSGAHLKSLVFDKHVWKQFPSVPNQWEKTLKLKLKNWWLLIHFKAYPQKN